MMWAFLVHLGYNFWCDTVPRFWKNHPTPESLKNRSAADHLRFDEETWRRVSETFPEKGVNTVVIDLGEGLVYPSHPELAVRGSWSAEKLERELSRLRAMGVTPIPKLNFSTSHDTWLGEYGRMVSTPTYYRVVEDLICDVIGIFGNPPFFHLGYDEENAENQGQYEVTVVRQGELWWHDFLRITGWVEKRGVRPWVWSDKLWNHPDEFLKRMPKSVLQSNWYYEGEFDLSKDWPTKKRAEAFLTLERGGFDQVPTAGNSRNRDDLRNMVEFCTREVSPERLRGFLMTTWRKMDPEFEPVQRDAVGLLAEARSIVRSSLTLSVAGVALACVASGGPLSPIRNGFALAAEQRSGTVVALDASRPGAQSFVWSWNPKRDPGIDKGDVRWFGAPSECKVVGSGKDRAVLMADSLGGFARIPFATGKADCYGIVGGNPHSVEQLPGGRFVVTASSMGHCLTLVEVSEHPFAPDVQPKKSYPLADAHGVVWDAGRTCLWAIGVSNIVRYAWHPERAELQAVRSCDFLNAAGRDGHDLQLGSDGRLRFTTGSVIACFDPENESFEVRDRRKDVKSDSVHADFGDLLVIVREAWWTDRLIVKRDGHEYEVGPYPGARFYKARWICR